MTIRLGGGTPMPLTSRLPANHDRRAEYRHTILVEALDGDPVGLADGECTQVERRALVGEALIGLIQLRRGDAPAHVVADSARYRIPRDPGIALVAIALRR